MDYSFPDWSQNLSACVAGLKFSAFVPGLKLMSFIAGLMFWLKSKGMFLQVKVVKLLDLKLLLHPKVPEKRMELKVQD